MKAGFLIVFLVLGWPILYGFSNQPENNIHPRFILTPENKSDFKKKAYSTHPELFELAEEQAQNFYNRPVINFENAHNKYREIGDGIPVLGLLYQIKNETKYIASAEKWIKAMLNTKSWEGSQNLGRSSWIVGLSFLYDWMYDALDKNLKAQLLKRLVTEAEIVVQTASYTRALSNHLLIETSAVGMVGLLLPDDHAQKQKFLVQANEWTNYIINHAPIDGSWGEGVQYWQYGTGYFLRFLEAAKTSGYKNYFPDYHWLKRTAYFPIYFSLPGNLSKVVNFSDCGTDRYLPAFLFYLPASKYKNGYFQDFGEKIQAHEPHKFSWLDFLFYDESIRSENYINLQHFKHFSDHGFVTMRSGWAKNNTLVGFRCGPAPGHKNQSDPERGQHKGFGPGHQQPDINSFVIFAQNEWLAIDPGYTKFKETRNHNTILVNGKGQAGAGGKWLDYMEFEARKPVPKIIYTENNEKFDYVIGDAGNIYIDEAELNHFRRHLLFLKPDIVIVYDELEAKRQSVFEWNLQFNEIAEVNIQGKNVQVCKNAVNFWVNLVLPYNAKISKKERRLVASDVHGLSGRSEGMLKTLSLQENAVSTNFLVIVSINNKGNTKKPEIKYDNQELTIVSNGKMRKLKILENPPEINKPLFKIIDN